MSTMAEAEVKVGAPSERRTLEDEMLRHCERSEAIQRWGHAQRSANWSRCVRIRVAMKQPRHRRWAGLLRCARNDGAAELFRGRASPLQPELQQMMRDRHPVGRQYALGVTFLEDRCDLLAG